MCRLETVNVNCGNSCWCNTVTSVETTCMKSYWECFESSVKIIEFWMIWMIYKIT